MVVESRFPLKEESHRPIPTFSEFMADFLNFLVNKLKIDPNRIEQKELWRDSSEDLQEVWIINNT